jgi:hypothetical protein
MRPPESLGDVAIDSGVAAVEGARQPHVDHWSNGAASDIPELPLAGPLL